MACRDLQKAEKAAAEVRLATAGVEGAGSVLVHRLDLASLASVRDCAQNILTSEPQIHILVNNAGKWSDLPRLSLLRVVISDVGIYYQTKIFIYNCTEKYLIRNRSLGQHVIYRYRECHTYEH